MKIELPKIYAIVNVEDFDSAITLVRKILDAKIEIIQIRCKLGLKLATKVTQETLNIRNSINSSCKIIVNDLTRVALECNADGVHLGQTDGDPISARNQLGSKSIIGLSCNNLSDLKNAPISCLSYLAFGPIFQTSSKPDHAPVVGLNLLKIFVKNSKLPVVAIGGINRNNMHQVFEAGASSCAMIREIEVVEDISSLIFHSTQVTC